MKIGVIGAGAMGSAMVKAFEDHTVFVCDRSLKKIEALGIKNGFTDPNEMISQVDALVFAVKPEGFKQLVESVKMDMSKKMIISVMNGITIAKLKDATGSKTIIRCMPNLAVQVKKGITAWIISKEVTEEHRHFIQNAFSRFGVSIEMENESQIYAITAISGAGPAYFFAFTQALTNAAKKMGIPAEQARLLAENTLVGSGKLLDSQNLSAEEWKHKIMVPGGTTRAGIKEFEKNNIDEIVLKAAKAAEQHAKEVSI